MVIYDDSFNEKFFLVKIKKISINDDWSEVVLFNDKIIKVKLDNHNVDLKPNDYNNDFWYNYVSLNDGSYINLNKTINKYTNLEYVDDVQIHSQKLTNSRIPNYLPISDKKYDLMYSNSFFFSDSLDNPFIFKKILFVELYGRKEQDLSDYFPFTIKIYFSDYSFEIIHPLSMKLVTIDSMGDTTYWYTKPGRPYLFTASYSGHNIYDYTANDYNIGGIVQGRYYNAVYEYQIIDSNLEFKRWNLKKLKRSQLTKDSLYISVFYPTYSPMK